MKLHMLVFFGGGGYTITLTVESGLKVSYCHCNPNFLVSEGDIIKQGQVIGNVGPKYVYGVAGNTYHDAYGPTNRCNNWSTFTFAESVCKIIATLILLITFRSTYHSYIITQRRKK